MEKLIAQIVYSVKELLGAFIGRIGTPGTVVDHVQSKISPVTFTETVQGWCKEYGYTFNSQLTFIQIKNPASPNTFNDWGLMFAQGKWVRWRNTCSGGKWTEAQKRKYNIKWVAEWLEGEYPDCFALTRDGATRFTRLGMPAFWNCRKVRLLNLETGKVEWGMNCDIHGRRSTSESVNLSSAGCLTTARGNDIYKVDEFFKTSQLYHREGLHARFGVIVANINDFPSIKGVRKL